MNKFTIVLLLFSLLLAAGCGSGDKTSRFSSGAPRERTIVVNPNLQSRSLGDLFSHVDYIPLETVEGSTISHIDKALYVGGRFYFMDNVQKALFCFDSKGSFISRFSNIGRGPNEYIEMMDFDLLPDGGGVVVLTDNDRLLYLDRDLSFIRESQAPVRGFGVSVITENVYGYYAGRWQNMVDGEQNNRFNLILHNKEKDELKGFVDASFAKRIGFSGGMRFYRSDVMTYSDPLGYDVCFLSLSGIDSVWHFDFGSSALSQGELDAISSMNEYISFLSDKQGFVTEVSDVYLFGDIVFFLTKVREGTHRGAQRGYGYYYLISKDEFYPVTVESNDLSRLRVPDMVLGRFEGGFFSQIPSFLLMNVDAGDLPESLRETDLADNPVIALYHVKK